MKNKREINLPILSYGNILANKFSHLRKTNEVRDGTDVGNSCTSESVAMNSDVAIVGQLLTQIELSTEDAVRDVIMKSPPESCDLDQLHVYPVRQALEYIFLLTIG